jgi:hypothetical protein
MADILYYAALDKYLYADTQLTAATDQASRATSRLTTAEASLTACTTCAGCCLCCLCCAEADKTARAAGAASIHCLNAKLCACPLDTNIWEEYRSQRKFPSENCSSYMATGGFFCVGDPSNLANDRCDQACQNSCCCTCAPYASGYYRCGGCYQWTVPSGVCCMEVELWGTGAWTTGACCCGGSPFAPSGAHAFASVTVTPGQVWCFCAGCAQCCTCACSNGASVMFTQGSTMCGPGMTMCAQGAWTYLKHQTSNAYAFGHRCRNRVASPQCIESSGGCWCNGGHNWCFDNSCESCGVIPMAAAEGRVFGCICANCPGNKFMYGIPGMHGCWCFDTNNYGYYKSPPIPGFPNHSQCCLSHSSNSCHGCCCRAETGYNAFPGQGGTRTHAMGGTTNCKGDNGRTGWVRVRYNDGT